MRLLLIATIIAVTNWTDKLSLVFTAILTLVGIVGIIVAICTLKIIERQTKATETAANAAKDSADALVGAERPWLIPSIKKPFSLTDGKRRIDWLITNTGRTTARIVEVKIRCKKYTGTEKLADTPEYREPIPFHGVPLAPGASLDAWCYMERGEKDYQPLSGTDIGEIREKGHNLIAYEKLVTDIIDSIAARLRSEGLDPTLASITNKLVSDSFPGLTIEQIDDREREILPIVEKYWSYHEALAISQAAEKIAERFVDGVRENFPAAGMSPNAVPWTTDDILRLAFYSIKLISAEVPD
jgi:hypothetical protein